jgi:hypothetical protein
MKILFSFLLLATLHVAYGQSTENKTIPGTEDYLRKSKRQKTLAWITAGTGLGVFTTGLIMYLSEYGNGLPGGTGYNEKTSKTGETLMYVGGGLVLVSVPFRIAYKRNKKLATSLSINNSRVVYPPLKDKAFSFVPSLCLRIGLAKH